MENETKQPLQPQPQNEKPQEVQKLADEIARLRESMNRAKAETSVEAARSKARAEELEQDCRSRARSTPVWAMVVLLTAGLLGATWFGYRALQGHNDLLAEIPKLEEVLGAVSKRVDATEETVRTWTAKWETVGARMGKIEKQVSGNLAAARKYAQEQANETYARLLSEMDNRTEWIQARLNRFETDQQANRARFAQLEEEIGDVRRETTQLIARAQQENGRAMGNLRTEINQNRDDLDTLARRLDRQRVDFEVAKNRNQELFRGVSLTVKKTNVSYQRVEGWVQLVPDGRTLWVRGQGIQQPLIFYTQQDTRPYELVFTRVTKDAALGYLMVPNQSAPRAAQLPASTGLPESAVAVLLPIPPAASATIPSELWSELSEEQNSEASQVR